MHVYIGNNLQDMHYMYMVSDLLLGGDLRYHLNQQGRFSEDRFVHVLITHLSTTTKILIYFDLMFY